MESWMDVIDPATIPDSILHAEVARRRSAKRVTKTGGRNGGRPVCRCGECMACKGRARMAEAMEQALTTGGKQ